MEKIKMTTPLVEMDGDEMTRVLWKMIKDELILPFVELKTEYYDLGLLHRNETKDQVTVEAANATRRLGVAVKCATITPNKQRMVEYPQLTEMWKSPNGTIRSILDGTVFRTPICIDTIHPVVKNWKKPITIARHAYGDVYKSVDLYTTEPGSATLTFVGESGEKKELLVQKVDGPAVWQAAHNKAPPFRYTEVRIEPRGIFHVLSEMRSAERRLRPFLLDLRRSAARAAAHAEHTAGPGYRAAGPPGARAARARPSDGLYPCPDGLRQVAALPACRHRADRCRRTASDGPAA